MGKGIIVGIDSDIELSLDEQIRCISNTWVYPYISNIPIYLVKPETMDKICPPRYERGIPLEKADAIAEVIDSFMKHIGRGEEVKDIDSELGRVWERIDYYSSQIVCEGVFIPGKVSEWNYEVGIDQSIKLPAIFVSPERIMESAEEISGELGVNKWRVFIGLLRSVIIHEATHAYNYMGSSGENIRKYREPYIRVLEEAIAQYSAYSSLSGEERVYFSKKSHYSTLEYNTWKTLVLPEPYNWYASYHLSHIWSNYLVKGRKPDTIPPLLFPLILPIYPIPYPILWPDIEEIHWLYIRLGLHEFYHRVVEPILISLYRMGSQGIHSERQAVERYLKILALYLLRRTALKQHK
jgi:hypothetical protein